MTDIQIHDTDFTIDAKITMDDLVNIQVSKIETALHDEKHNLLEQIKLAKKEIDKEMAIYKDTLLQYAKSNVELPKSPFFEFKIASAILNKDVIEVTITCALSDGKDQFDRHSISTHTTLKAKVSHKKMVDTLNNLQDKIHELESEMMEIAKDISDLPRKERQVRAQIAEAKLNGNLSNPTKIKQLLLD